jgi:hypothetical protein
VKTRTLLLLAIGCGILILAAGTIQLLRLSGDDHPAATLTVGASGTAGDVAVRLDAVASVGNTITATVSISGVDDPKGLDGFRLVFPQTPLAPQPGGCAGITVAEQHCALSFDAGGRAATGGVLIFQRGEDTLRWRLDS